jgi:hypothetical protein
MKLRGLGPNFYIHVSVSDLYIPTIGQHILLEQNRLTDRSQNMNWECGRPVHFWKYINRILFAVRFRRTLFQSTFSSSSLIFYFILHLLYNIKKRA